MNDKPLTFFCDDCGSLKLITDQAEGTSTCLRCHNAQAERHLRRMRSPSLEEIRKTKPPNIHDD